MRKVASKPFEVIIINAFLTKIQDGDVMICMALDEYSEYLFPPKFAQMGISDDEFIQTLMDFFNGIHQKYDRKKHPQKITYVVDFPQQFIPLIQGMVTMDGEVIYDPRLVERKFRPVLKEFNNFQSNKRN